MKSYIAQAIVVTRTSVFSWIYFPTLVFARQCEEGQVTPVLEEEPLTKKSNCRVQENRLVLAQLEDDYFYLPRISPKDACIILQKMKTKEAFS